jgi:1-acyl-sn-glycerol-3-phosphate acyltransferase
VEGLELLIPGQTYVYAANHRSAIDIFALAAILPGKFMWVAKESIFKIPIIGQVLARLGSVPVDRSNLQKAMRSLNLAAARVRGGMSVIIFPEGTRAETPEILPFKKGVFVMAFKAGQPIVPVSISGTMAIQPRGSFRVRPGPVKVVISKPIDPQDFPRKEDLIAAVHRAVAANYEPYFPYGPGGADG